MLGINLCFGGWSLIMMALAAHHADGTGSPART
jgi:hypothetical protein